MTIARTLGFVPQLRSCMAVGGGGGGGGLRSMKEFKVNSTSL